MAFPIITADQRMEQNLHHVTLIQITNVKQYTLLELLSLLLQL